MIGHPQGASGAAGVVATRAGAAERRAAADDQPDRSGSRLRPGFHPAGRAGGSASMRCCATVSASDRRTARSCSGGPERPCWTSSSQAQDRPGRLRRSVAGAGRRARAPRRSRGVSARQALRRHAQSGRGADPRWIAGTGGGPARHGAAARGHARDRSARASCAPLTATAIVGLGDRAARTRRVAARSGRFAPAPNSSPASWCAGPWSTTTGGAVLVRGLVLVAGWKTGRGPAPAAP